MEPDVREGHIAIFRDERRICCERCGQEAQLPPRRSPAFAAAAIEGFVRQHANCPPPPGAKGAIQ